MTIVRRDPFGIPLDNLQSFNRYSYVFNNPLSFTDPSGFTVEEAEKRRKDAEDVARDQIIQEKGIFGYVVAGESAQAFIRSAGDYAAKIGASDAMSAPAPCMDGIASNSIASTNTGQVDGSPPSGEVQKRNEKLKADIMDRFMALGLKERKYICDRYMSEDTFAETYAGKGEGMWFREEGFFIITYGTYRANDKSQYAVFAGEGFGPENPQPFIGPPYHSVKQADGNYKWESSKGIIENPTIPEMGALPSFGPQFRINKTQSLSIHTHLYALGYRQEAKPSGPDFNHVKELGLLGGCVFDPNSKMVWFYSESGVVGCISFEDFKKKMLEEKDK